MRRSRAQGVLVPEVGREDIRELIVPPYRILYRLRESTCLILSVRHARQLTTPGTFGRLHGLRNALAAPGKPPWEVRLSAAP